MNDNDEMEPEYDFSNGVRGKFYAGPNAVFHIPVYLDQDVLDFLTEKATCKGTNPDQLANELLRHAIEAYKALA